MKIPNILFLLIVLLIFCSCVKEPTGPDNTGIKHLDERSAYVLCEGIWNYDNASLTRIDFDSNMVVNNYFKKSNPGLRLGDLANDIVIHKNIAYIAVSTTKTIEAIELDSGRSLGRIVFDGKLQPREITIVNDSLGFVTDLYDYAVYKFNPQELTLYPGKITVGPAPEGIAHFNDLLFVANSGYGDILKDQPGAGTISVIDINTASEIEQIPAESNVLELIVSPQNEKLYALYSKLASEHKDSLGGIIEFNLSNFQRTHHWRTNSLSMTFSQTGDTLLFINHKGIAMIDLRADRGIEQLIENKNLEQHWYSLAVSPYDNSIWIGNARNYQIMGEVLVYANNSYESPSEVFQVGINPAKIVFPN